MGCIVALSSYFGNLDTTTIVDQVVDILKHLPDTGVILISLLDGFYDDGTIRFQND
jgi:hypothetical protein